MTLRFLLATLALLFAASACGGSSSPNGTVPAPKPVQACSSIVLTGHPAYPPVAWADGATLKGGGIQVIRRVARDNGVTVHVVNEGTWDDAQMAVRNGQADAIVGLYRTQARLAYFSYVSPPLAPDPSSVLIKRGAPLSYTGWNSLIGKTGVVGVGESYGTKFDAFLKSKLTTHRVNSLQDIYQALLDGKADYGLSGYYAAVTTAPKTIAFATPDFVTEGLYLAFAKDSLCARTLTPAFSREIATLAANGTIKRIFAKALKQYEKTHPHP
jgi:polar amino acid transport system substrate-binding protein